MPEVNDLVVVQWWLVTRGVKGSSGPVVLLSLTTMKSDWVRFISPSKTQIDTWYIGVIMSVKALWARICGKALYKCSPLLLLLLFYLLHEISSTHLYFPPLFHSEYLSMGSSLADWGWGKLCVSEALSMKTLRGIRFCLRFWFMSRMSSWAQRRSDWPQII